MNARLLLVIVIISMIFIGCDGSGIAVEDEMNFVDDFMQTFEYERSMVTETDRSIQPLMKGLLSGEVVGTSDGSRATVPSYTTDLSFSDTTGSFSGYPYPGQTTSYVLVKADFGDDVYKITSTTDYGDASDIVDYVEVYFVRDITVGDDASAAESATTPDGIWNEHDPIVNTSNEQDQSYRDSMTVTFTDGSVRNEFIVKIPEAGEGFAEFDVYGSLDYPDFSYPETDSTADYSSVVLYTYENSEEYDYSFWEGAVNKYIVGVRYYTEHSFTGDVTYGTLVSYERAVSSYDAVEAVNGENLSDLATVFGTSFATLAETVFRQEVVFDTSDTYPTAETLESRMQSHVVNATEYEDFLIELINDDTSELSDFDAATYYIPSGATADEIVVEDGDESDFLTQTTIENPDGEDVEIIDTPDVTSDLYDLYVAINTGVYEVDDVADTANDISEDDIDSGTLIVEAGDVWSFDGNAGQLIDVTDPESDNYDSEVAATVSFSSDDGHTAGTVMAWVYVIEHSNYAGIIHKGIEPDFSDEAYSLQFWGNRGNVAFAVVEQDPQYKYTSATSSVRLNTGKWYFLVGTFEEGEKVYAYVFGEDLKKDYYVKSSNNKIDNIEEGGPLLIGSQFSDGTSLSNYYGFDGSINGVVIDNTKAWTEAELYSYYEANKAKTEFWPTGVAE